MSDQFLYETEARAIQRDPRANSREAGTRQAMPPTNGPRLQRRRRTSNPFDFDKRIVPEGMSYEVKRESIYGQPTTAHQTALRENHWRPVPAARHPELAPVGETVIRHPGAILMERPAYLTEEARLEDIHEGMAPVLQKEELMYGTPPGQLTRNHPSVRNFAKINEDHGPVDPAEHVNDGTYAEP